MLRNNFNSTRVLQVFKFLLLALGFVLSFPAGAAIPHSLDGEALPSLAPMLERTTPGVVNIATRGKVRIQNNPLLDDPFFRHFFNIPNRPRERVTQSLGSGVIVDAKNGYILTNHHVIAAADEITITLSDERQLDARLVGTDEDSDVAVIQVDGEGLTAVPWGDSDKLRVGDFVVAIGNPFGLGQTVTSGIVSALGRSGLGIEAYEDFIQTDASINPGNSGGALVNLRGELIGINTAIIGPSGGNVGIGFAIPAIMAKQIMSQLIQYGEVRRGALGIVVQNLTPNLAKAFGVKSLQGVVISQVEPDSPAEKSGLMPGDVLISVNGKRVKHSADMRNVIGLQRIGQKIEMTIIRNGQEKNVSAIIKQPQNRSVDGAQFHSRLAGATLAKPEANFFMGGESGVMVIDVQSGSPASAAGIRKGDIIISVNRQEVNSPEDIDQVIKQGGRAMLLNILRGSRALFLLLQ